MTLSPCRILQNVIQLKRASYASLTNYPHYFLLEGNKIIVAGVIIIIIIMIIIIIVDKIEEAA